MTGRKTQVGFVLALACLGLVGLASFWSVARLNESAAWTDHTHQVLDRLESLIATATDAETAERGYVISGDDRFLEPYRHAPQRIDASVSELRRLTADNPDQQQRLDALVALIAERFDSLRLVVQLRRDQGFEAARNEVLSGKGKRSHDQIRGLIDQMEATETSLLAERERQVRNSTLLAQAVIATGSLLAIGMVGFALATIRRDLAGRMRAERALRELNDELEARVQQRTRQLAHQAAIIKSSDDAIISKNLDSIITSWNPGAEKLFGYSEQEALGKSITMLIPPERLSEEPIIIAGIARGEMTDHFETVRLRKDGQRIDVSITISPIRDSDGKVVGASKIARDITERKLAEQKVQAQLARLNLLQQITQAIGERQDARSIYQVAVRTLEEHLPADLCCICLYDAAESVLIVTSVGRRSEALATELAMSEQARIPIDQNGLSRCVRGRLVYEPDISGSVFPFPERLARGGLTAMVAAPLMAENKAFGVLFAARRQANSFSSGECEFIQQLSEHVALASHQAGLYSQLQRAYDDLRHTQQAVLQQERLLALGQMASGIAHDINNAISPVALYTELVLEKEANLSAASRSRLETIQRAVDDVGRTVARMREFYRARDEQSVLAAVDMNRLVREVVDLTRARWSDMAQRSGISIEMRTDLAADLPVVMGADNEIRDALINLIFNAVDAMPEGGPLTVRTSVTRKQDGDPDGRRFVSVEVIDGGTGMDEETRRRCLEPFYTTKGERGTGLGLSMVYGTVQRHSAEMEIDSAVGEGTTVRLSFPVAADNVVSEAAAIISEAIPSQRILVVDDDPLVLNSVRDVLEGDGHSVTTADGGQRGIDAFLAAKERGEPFPVVITDLGMPYVDGRKVSTAIKAAAPDTVVLMLTGWGQRLVAEADVPPHVDCVLSKPPRLSQLRAALAQYCAAPVS